MTVLNRQFRSLVFFLAMHVGAEIRKTQYLENKTFINFQKPHM